MPNFLKVFDSYGGIGRVTSSSFRVGHEVLRGLLGKVGWRWWFPLVRGVKSVVSTQNGRKVEKHLPQYVIHYKIHIEVELSCSTNTLSRYKNVSRVNKINDVS